MTRRTSPKPGQSARKKPASAPGKSEVLSRSLQDVAGPSVYSAWVALLRSLVPDGRTHRLAVLVAAMLQYALNQAAAQDDDPEEGSLARSLLDSADTADPSEVRELLHDAVTRLFNDAGVTHSRVSAKGQHYSIADSAYDEYVRWFDMPWE